MKKILLTLAAVAMSVSAFAQTTTANGLISYYNRVLQDASINGGASRNEPIRISDEAATAAGLPTSVDFASPAFSIGLFLKNANGTYTLANLPGDGTTPGTTPGLGAFRAIAGTANDGTMAGPITVELAGKPAGTAATFQIRAWLTSQGNFDTATVRGNSADLTVSQLGGNTASGSLATPNLSGLGFTAFTITPEPSTYALGIAGLGALAMMRRRKA
jgi:hypothetical protein